MRAPLLLAAGLLAVAGAVLYRQRLEGGGIADAAGGLLESVDTAGAEIMSAASGYSAASVPQQYRAAIAQAETSNGIPDGLLARLLWQESRYRADIIDGRVKSPTGATGIAQFMPKTAPEWSVDLYDGSPFDDIAGAGKYLAWLYRKTGSWALALAAYNWGVGNLQRKGIEAAPLETRNYFSQILADVGLA